MRKTALEIILHHSTQFLKSCRQFISKYDKAVEKLHNVVCRDATFRQDVRVRDII